MLVLNMELRVKTNIYKIPPAISLILTTIAVFILSNNPITAPSGLFFTLISLVSLLVHCYLKNKQGQKVTNTQTFVYLLVVFVLFLVASTGWFFSPFFYTLYLLSILISFTFTPRTSLAFTLTLIALLSLNIGQTNLTYDILVILSLLTVIPLNFYLKKNISLLVKKK